MSARGEAAQHAVSFWVLLFRLMLGGMELIHGLTHLGVMRVVGDPNSYAPTPLGALSALIQLEFDTVGKWAESRGIAFTHFRSLAESAQVRELIQQEVARANAGLAPVAQIKRFHLLTKELDHDDGEVTATMKVRRASIYKTYAAEIEALYQ